MQYCGNSDQRYFEMFLLRGLWGIVGHSIIILHLFWKIHYFCNIKSVVTFHEQKWPYSPMLHTILLLIFVRYNFRAYSALHVC